MHLGSQVFVTESCCWLTGPFKIAKNAHNTRFLRLARLGSAGRGVVLGRRNVGLSRPGSPFVSSAQPALSQTGCCNKSVLPTAWPQRVSTSEGFAWLSPGLDRPFRSAAVRA